MSASSLTTCAIETTINSNDEVESTFQVAKKFSRSVFKVLDHIGTSVALGEAGDLEAADSYRRKNSGH